MADLSGSMMEDFGFSGDCITRKRAEPSRIGNSISRMREDLRSLMGVVMTL